MRIFRSFFALALLLNAGLLTAQDFQGVATYQTSTKLDFKLDTNVASAEQQKAMMQMIAPMLQKEYTLTFSKTESLYKEAEKLEESAFPFADMFSTFLGAGGTMFKNVQSRESVRQVEFLGKIFLVTDTLKQLEWKLGKENKTIGSYTCYKATAQKEVIEKTIQTEAGTEDFEEEDSVKVIEITAWYTPQIPVSQGPDSFWGLPGLVMEASDGTNTFLCSKVVLNPKDKVTIERPKDGEVVTAEEFTEIMRKKAEELSEAYGGGSDGRDAGNSEFKIQISK